MGQKKSPNTSMGDYGKLPPTISKTPLKGAVLSKKNYQLFRKSANTSVNTTAASIPTKAKLKHSLNNSVTVGS